MPRVRLKVSVIGDAGVGKTSLIKRYLGHPFSEIYVRTLGVDFFSKAEVFRTPAGTLKIVLDIHDFGGQEGFENVRRLAYFGTHVGILVFDVSDRESFRNTIKWVEEFVTFAGKRPLILVGNKIDLRKEAECTVPEDGEDLASKIAETFGLKVTYVESSAKLGINVELPFKAAVYRALTDEEVRSYVAAAVSPIRS